MRESAVSVARSSVATRCTCEAPTDIGPARRHHLGPAGSRHRPGWTRPPRLRHTALTWMADAGVELHPATGCGPPGPGRHIALPAPGCADNGGGRRPILGLVVPVSSPPPRPRGRPDGQEWGMKIGSDLVDGVRPGVSGWRDLNPRPLDPQIAWRDEDPGQVACIRELCVQSHASVRMPGGIVGPYLVRTSSVPLPRLGSSLSRGPRNRSSRRMMSSSAEVVADAGLRRTPAGQRPVSVYAMGDRRQTLAGMSMASPASLGAELNSAQ